MEYPTNHLNLLLKVTAPKQTEIVPKMGAEVFGYRRDTPESRIKSEPRPFEP